MARSGFYTNRIRYSDMLNRFKSAGFNVEVSRIDKWKSLPIERNKMYGEYKMLPDTDLLVSGFDVILRPIKNQTADQRSC